jgi:hypothetical protein
VSTQVLANCLANIPRIQYFMRLAKLFLRYRLIAFVPLVGIASAILAAGLPLGAQESPQGPLQPPPEHHVTRIGNEAEPEAPPSLPEAEIIKRFSQKEDEYLLARARYIYKRTVRIQEFGLDGTPTGEYDLVTMPARSADGKIFEKVVEKPRSTLLHFFLRPEDLEGLQRIPLFPLTTSQLAKYDLKYLGKEQVDEIECYIFQAKPKIVERVRAYFDGIVWVDTKYLEVVKTYGKWVNDQGDMRSVAELPFSLFETYRENVDGKCWFPNYSRSDDTLRIKDLEIPVRIVIKWTDFKLVPGPPPLAPSVPAKPQT